MGISRFNTTNFGAHPRRLLEVYDSATALTKLFINTRDSSLGKGRFGSNSVIRIHTIYPLCLILRRLFRWLDLDSSDSLCSHFGRWWFNIYIFFLPVYMLIGKFPGVIINLHLFIFLVNLSFNASLRYSRVLLLRFHLWELALRHGTRLNFRWSNISIGFPNAFWLVQIVYFVGPSTNLWELVLAHWSSCLCSNTILWWWAV